MVLNIAKSIYNPYFMSYNRIKVKLDAVINRSHCIFLLVLFATEYLFSRSMFKQILFSAFFLYYYKKK